MVNLKGQREPLRTSQKISLTMEKQDKKKVKIYHKVTRVET